MAASPGGAGVAILPAVSCPNAKQEVWTVSRLLGWTKEYLARQGVDQPRLCAEVLLAHVLGCQKIDLYTRFEEKPSEGERAALRELVRRAAQQEPIAYLVGEKEFFSLAFIVTPAVLIPRPETETLVQEALDRLRSGPSRASRVLDLATGSGCIAVTLARQCSQVTVVACEISAEASEVARRNAERHGVGDRVEVRVGDLYAVLRADDEPFELVTANPPYLSRQELAKLPATVRDYEPQAALVAGDDALAVHRRIIAGCGDWLSAGGWLLLEVAFNQAEAVRGLLAAQPGFDQLHGARDGLGYERVLCARRGGVGNTPGQSKE